MKILYYNWDHIDGTEGGGVVVYQKNLINELCLQKNVEIYYLNSGLTYNGKTPYISELDNNIMKGVRIFELFNSPVLAPARQSPINIDKYLTDNTTYVLLKEFIAEYGPFDILHFNNVEGLGISVFKIKNNYPNMKIIYTVHNYFPICSRVNLWQNEKCGMPHNCIRHGFEECINCYNKYNYDMEKFSRRYNKIRGSQRFKHIVTKINPDKLKDEEKLYYNFEKSNINYLNKYVDIVLAVSNRVKKIMIDHGIDPKKIETSYIGTNVANYQKKSSNANIHEEIFSIVYMGYMRKEKGFYFLLDSFEKLYKKDPDLAKKIKLTFIARYDSSNVTEIKRINNLKKNYFDVELVNGYNKENQERLLKGKNLGIVPVLWEDNLPQVAIEQIAYGVPILVSDLGGARELFDDNDFVFKAGDNDDFIKKLLSIIHDRNKILIFWKQCKTLITMEQHINYIKKIYGMK